MKKLIIIKPRMRQLKISQSVTNRSTKAVDNYLSDISKLPMVNQEREIELTKKIKEGDEEALLELVQANLRFVVSVAKQYQNRGLELLDLINEGNLGLIKAAKRFDETRGFKFISFAVWWVRQSILEAISNNGRLIRVPLNKIGLQKKFLTSYSKLEQQLGRQPNDEEVMIDMGIGKKEIVDLMATMARVTSYDAPVSESDNSESVMDLMRNPNGDLDSPDELLVNRESARIDINRMFSTLKISEKDVLERYFGLNDNRQMSLAEIAHELEYSSERVRQIKEAGLRRLRVIGRARLLRGHLN